MSTQHLFYPMAFYVFYIFYIGKLSFKARTKAVRSGEVKARYFKTYSGEELPERVIVLGRHYDNQFQLPLLFLLTALASIQSGGGALLSNTLAWVFVISRLIHSYLHLGKNHPLHRAYANIIGWVAIVLMWLNILWTNLSIGP